jgi:hypothetical protein
MHAQSFAKRMSHQSPACGILRAQSFAKGVDMEDLGCADAAELGCTQAGLAVPPELAMPAWLKAHNKQVGLFWP